MRHALAATIVTLMCLGAPPSAPPARAAHWSTVKDLTAAFEAYSGAKLVFARAELPKASYYERMPTLSAKRKRAAAELLLGEVKKYPPGFLGRIGLDAIGVFDACVSTTGDGFRPYEEALKGYRYYGVWNGRDGIAAAYYTNGQLPLTFHHEIFHHVDATSKGRTNRDASFSSDDAAFRAAYRGERRYRALNVSAADRRLLSKRAGGGKLVDAVSDYAKKNAGEDQAETARHFMTNLPDGLLQAAVEPALAGSQRILHILGEYADADPAASAAWFLNVATGRAAETKRATAGKQASPARGQGLLAVLRSQSGDIEARRQALLTAEALLVGGQIPPELAKDIARAAAPQAHTLMRQRVAPRASDRSFTIHGAEDASGANQTLRADVRGFGQDAGRVRRMVALAGLADDQAAARSVLRSAFLLGRYYTFVAGDWTVTPGTRAAFEDARASMLAALPEPLQRRLKEIPLERLGEALSADGSLSVAPANQARAPRRSNKYLANVDAEIREPDVRAAIRAVQPAAARLSGTGGGSGVVLSSDGWVLTAAHVAKRVGAKVHVRLPDGRKLTGRCEHVDHHLDIAVVKVSAAAGSLPWAPLADSAPKRGTPVVAIGQPGGHTPDGEATGYQPFHVSRGEIRGFLPNRLGDQSLGRTKHDAWTYWGHSGCPIFDERGRIVAMHNSWDSKTAMRHAVTWEALVHFLDAKGVPYQRAR